MNKRRISVTVMACFVLMVSGCQKESNGVDDVKVDEIESVSHESSTQENASDSAEIQTNDDMSESEEIESVTYESSIQENVSDSTEIQTNDDMSESEVIEKSDKNVYCLKLYSLIESNGKIDNQLIFENGIDEEKDKFAICDVNGDGKQELILLCNSSDDTWENIYQINEDKNEIIRIESLPCSENNSYYDNGIILAQSEYQSPLSGRFCDYVLYQEIDGTYFHRANLTAWEKEVDSNDFPEDIDVTKQGIVYYIEYPHISDSSEIPVSQEEYDIWLEGYIGEANKIDVEYHILSRQNIDEIYGE